MHFNKRFSFLYYYFSSLFILDVYGDIRWTFLISRRRRKYEMLLRLNRTSFGKPLKHCQNPQKFAIMCNVDVISSLAWESEPTWTIVIERLTRSGIKSLLVILNSDLENVLLLERVLVCCGPNFIWHFQFVPKIVFEGKFTYSGEHSNIASASIKAHAAIFLPIT